MASAKRRPPDVLQERTPAPPAALDGRVFTDKGVEYEPDPAVISFSFYHGLGDVANFAHGIALYVRRGKKVEVECAPDKACLFRAAGASIVPKAKFSHAYLHPPVRAAADLYAPWDGNKCADNLSEPPLPDIGPPSRLWDELIKVRLTLEDQVPWPVRLRVTTALADLPRPIILLHTKAHTGPCQKNLDHPTTDRLCEILTAETPGTLVLLDWDRGVPKLKSPRVRHILEDLWGMNLIDLWALYEQADLLIAVDSGPLHFARFCPNIPALGIWHRHYPSQFALPRERTVHLVPSVFRERDLYRRVAFNTVLEDEETLTAETIARHALRMLRGPRYLQAADQVARDVQLQSFIDRVRRSQMEPAPQAPPTANPPLTFAGGEAATRADVLRWRQLYLINRAFSQGLLGSRGWQLLWPLRAVRRWLRPFTVDARSLLPWNQLEPDPLAAPGTWIATGPEPHFIAPCALPAGMLRVRLRLTCEVPGLLALYAHTGDAGQEPERLLQVEVSGTVDIDQRVRLRRPALGIRLQPINSPARLHLERLQLVALAPGARELAPVGRRVRRWWRRLKRLVPYGAQWKRVHRPGSVATHAPATPYQEWLARVSPTAADLAWMKRNAPHLTFQPHVSLLTVVSSSAEVLLLARTLESLRAQAYPRWELCVACDPLLANQCRGLAATAENHGRVSVVAAPVGGSATAYNEALEAATGELVGLVSAGDVLAPEALFEIVYHLNRHPETDLVYSDEDVAAGGTRQRPRFKPDWSPDLLLALNYVGRFWVVRDGLLRDAGGFRGDRAPAAEYDAVLRCTNMARRVGHVPRVLYTALEGPENEKTIEPNRAVVEEALWHRGVEGEVLAGPAPGTLRVRRAVRGRPLVSIVVPSDGEAGARSVASIQQKTAYANHEIIAVQTGPGAGHAGGFPAGPRLKRRTFPPSHNRSQVLNQAAAHAEGEYLVFADAVEVVTSDWVEAMLEYAADPDVAAVGVKVLDGRGRVEQAGLVLGKAGPRPAFKGIAADEAGPSGLASLARNCSAVSTAALMVRRRLFHELDGFDEQFGSWQRDVDFCLRARAKGLRVVTTPYAVLARSGNPDDGAGEPESDSPLYWTRWRTVHEQGDQFHNPNLTTADGGHRLDEEPVVLSHVSGSATADERPRRILVVNLGPERDVVASLPAQRRLREAFPGAEITALVAGWSKPPEARIHCEPWARIAAVAGRSAKPLLAGNVVDRVLTFETSGVRPPRGPVELTEARRRDVAGWLAPMGFDLAIDLGADGRMREFVRLSGARRTAGFGDAGEFAWLDLALPLVNGRSPGGGLHSAQEMVYLVEAVAAAYRPAVYPVLPSSAEEQERVDRLLEIALERPAALLVGIHPGAANNGEAWPAEHFARLADLFAERLPARVVVFGDEEDTDLVRRTVYRMRCRRDAVVLAGELDIREFLAAVRRCDLFVGHNSGPAHLAASTGVPTLAVHTSSDDPRRCGPLGPAAAVIHRAARFPAAEVTDQGARAGAGLARAEIGVETVWEAARRVLLPRWSNTSRPASGETPAGETATDGRVASAPAGAGVVLRKAE